jgi:hypothetical protein
MNDSFLIIRDLAGCGKTGLAELAQGDRQLHLQFPEIATMLHG